MKNHMQFPEGAPPVREPQPGKWLLTRPGWLFDHGGMGFETVYRSSPACLEVADDGSRA